MPEAWASEDPGKGMAVWIGSVSEYVGGQWVRMGMVDSWRQAVTVQERAMVQRTVEEPQVWLTSFEGTSVLGRA